MTHSINTLTREFAKGTGRKLCHPTVTLRYPLGAPNEYVLHNSTIATLDPSTGAARLYWRGFYTPTTANHLKHLALALGLPSPGGYALARKNQIP